MSLGTIIFNASLFNRLYNASTTVNKAPWSKNCTTMFNKSSIKTCVTWALD